MDTKFIFVTGGVVSSLGKGISAASVGLILKKRGFKVFTMKFDPYLNVDPGTMSPYQHGEVFVTDDGAETDLDLGHYERWLDINLTKEASVTSGKIYSSVLEKERRGDYLGACVQVIPHVTNEIKQRLLDAAKASGADIVIAEIGGTVGDIESQPFLQAIRQARLQFGYDNTFFLHNTLVPYLKTSGETKTKPTQHSVKEMASLGLQPDAIILAAHQGWVPNTDTRGVNDIEDIASRFPEIALILGAHTHRDFPGTTIGHRTWYLQPPPHANAVAHATLTIDTDAHRVVSVTSQLLPVPRNTPHDPELEQALLPFIRQEQHERQRLLVASLAQAIPSRGIPGTSCATSELIATAIAQATGAAVVFHGKLSNHELPAGKLHGHDLHRLLPYDNAIVTATLTLDDIQTILNEQLKWRRHYSFNGIYGATATLNPATGQATLTGLGKTGTLPPDTTNAQRLLVAFNSHAAAGSGRFTALRAILAQPQANTTQLNLSTRQAVENFLAKHPNLTLTPFPWLQ